MEEQGGLFLTEGLEQIRGLWPYDAGREGWEMESPSCRMSR